MRNTGVLLSAPKNDQADLEEKYNDLLAKVNELSKKKVEVTNTIKTKTKNLELLEKARYANTGRDSSTAKAGEDGATFSLIHIAGVFLLFFVLGVYYSSG